ncbi:MAG: Lrp/AsnC family transcriptional regulator [Candidatus Hodarchaeales archaeon]|jgi:Lrp/AsnC family leucine-responsive transcriptional regulator
MVLVESIRIDEYDRKIIALLKKNAKISQDEIARQIKLSRPTVQKRIKNLEENQVIKFIIQTNDKKLGKPLTVFILVVLDRAQRVWEFTYNELQDRMGELEILEIHHIAGQEDVILKLKTRNIDSLETILIEVSEMKGVARTRTLICLSSLEPEFEMPRNY